MSNAMPEAFIAAIEGICSKRTAAQSRQQALADFLAEKLHAEHLTLPEAVQAVANDADLSTEQTPETAQLDNVTVALLTGAINQLKT